MRKQVLVFGLVLFLGLFGTLTLLAQTETGQIAGSVTDPSGASVPGAKVTLTSTTTGAARVVTTGTDGGFTITNLLPTVYKVRVEAQGFKTVEQQVEVTVGTKVALDIKLEVGATSTVVEVTAAPAVVVNTETQTVSQVIDSQMITQLPIADTRNPYSLVVTSGNVSEDDPTGRGVGVAINGQRASSTNVLLDGSANNDEFIAAVGQYVPLDSVQEFSLLTSNFTAEYGRASGGIVNLTTKSGTNNFHGSAYEYNRLSKLASNDFDNNAYGLDKGIYTRNQFGYSIGGPIKKDKLFFFQSTEWTRIRSSAPQINFIPDAALISASAADTQTFFSQYGGTLRPGLSTLQAYTRGDLAAQGSDPCQGKAAPDPCGSLPMSTPMFDKVTYNIPGDSGGGWPQNTYDLVGRVDWNATDKTSVYGRYAFYNEADLMGSLAWSPYAGYDTTNFNKNSNFLLSMTHTFSPTLVSQSKIVFNRLNNTQPLGKNPAGPTLYFNGAVATRLLGTTVMLPGYLPDGPGTAIPFGGPQNFLQLYEDVSKVVGKHTLRFGGAYTYMRDNRTFGAYQEAVAALSTGNINDAAMDRLLTGVIRSFQAAIDPQGKYPCGASKTPDCTVTLPVGQPNFSRSNRYNEFGFYAQDAWKVSRRLTLNLGLRWEYYGVQHNKNPKLDSNFYYGTGANIYEQIRNGSVMLAPDSSIGGLWAKDYRDFAPRLGFAWDVFGDGKTSLRGGWGIGYERNFGNVTFNVIQNPPNYAVISIVGDGVDVPSIPIPTSLMGPMAGSTGSKALPGVSLRAVNPNIKTAYAHFWSFGAQREVARKVVLDLEYSGSRGVGLYDISNINRYGSGNVYLGDPCPDPPCYDRLRTTQFTNVNFRGDGGWSNYNALNTRVDIRDLHGVNFRINYTWAHAMDNLSDTFSSSGNSYNLGYLDAFNPMLDKGDAQFDNRHRLAVSGIWLVPFAKNTHGVVKHVLDGWSFAPILTMRTGNPYAIFDCTNAVTVCIRMVETAALPRSPQKATPVPDIPNTFNMLSLCSGAPNDFTGCNFDSSYVNPVVGYSDFGPYPTAMTGRDAFRTPGNWNLDFAIHKNFAITERYNLQFRAEMFNAFNHANLYASTGSAEVESQPYIPASRYGHRNIQMALRFTF
jgi:outer membrane receptor protein involved in Fe transport